MWIHVEGSVRTYDVCVERQCAGEHNFCVHDWLRPVHIQTLVLMKLTSLKPIAFNLPKCGFKSQSVVVVQEPSPSFNRKSSKKQPEIDKSGSPKQEIRELNRKSQSGPQILWGFSCVFFKRRGEVGAGSWDQALLYPPPPE